MPSSSRRTTRAHLAVRLQADEAEDDVDAGLFQLAGPDDVALLVEPGLQLDDGRHLLAVVGGALQGPHDRRIAAGAVERLLDGQHALVVGGGLDEIDDVAERLVGMMHQDVAGADGRATGRAPGRTPATGCGTNCGSRRCGIAGQAVDLEQAASGRAGRGCGSRRTASRSRAVVRNCSISAGASASICRRTAAPRRRLRTSSSMVLSRSSTSSSSISMSLLRVTRKTASLLEGHAGKQVRQVQADDGLPAA